MNPFSCRFRPRRLCLALVACSTLSFALQPEPSLELTRPVRSWEFLSAVGTRAGLFGNEQGTVEAWVYPLKILRDFHLRFHLDGTVLPAESLARTVIVRPESSTIVYTGDVFSVRETLFVPVHESGGSSPWPSIPLSLWRSKPCSIRIFSWSGRARSVESIKSGIPPCMPFASKKYRESSRPWWDLHRR